VNKESLQPQELFRKSQRLHIGEHTAEFEPHLIQEARLEFANDAFRENIRATIEKTLDLKNEKSVELLLRFHTAVKVLIYVLRVFKKREYDSLRNERANYLAEEENKENNVYHLQNALENNDGAKKERRTRVWENNVRRRSSIRSSIGNGVHSSFTVVNESSQPKARTMNPFSIPSKIETSLNWTFIPFYCMAYVIGKIIPDNQRLSELIKPLVLLTIIAVYSVFSFLICWLHGDIFWSVQKYWNISSLLFQTFLIAVPYYLFFQSDINFSLAAFTNQRERNLPTLQRYHRLRTSHRTRHCVRRPHRHGRGKLWQRLPGDECD